MAKIGEIHFTPGEVLLGAFGFFGTKRLDLGSLRRIATVVNCPSEAALQGVLQNLVEEGMLIRIKDKTGEDCFELPDLPIAEIQ